MSADLFVREFVARVRAEAAQLTAYGAEASASATLHVADELEDAFRRWQLEALPIAVAATESGYSEDRLRELVREGRLPDAREDGEGPLQVRRCNLPRRMRDPVEDVDVLERRLLHGAAK